MQRAIFLDMLAQNELTCSFALNRITADNSRLRLTETAASVGFIYRHLAETMHLFGTFFGIPTPVQNTTMGRTDEGDMYELAESQRLLAEGYAQFRKLVETTADEVWLQPIDTPFFGTVSWARLFAHVLFHNAHHAGQIAMTLAHGK
ncbi:DinB family protein [Fibrella sp. WM1]|uniref:DinB family protein n=1 Tax=Fibrella musci TaxID=3242485 RepID=UPI003520BF05